MAFIVDDFTRGLDRGYLALVGASDGPADLVAQNERQGMACRNAVVEEAQIRVAHAAPCC